MTIGKASMPEESKDGGSACGCGSGDRISRSGRAKWVWVILAAAVAGVLIAKNSGKDPGTGVPGVTNRTPAGGLPGEAATQGQALPRLVDLGAGKCIPCKMMAPILEELRKTYAGKLEVVFIDVWENPDAGKQYGINLIPTQIFYDAQGKELFRHEGFFGKEDILAKWKDLGVELPAAATNAAAGGTGGGA